MNNRASMKPFCHFNGFNIVYTEVFVMYEIVILLCCLFFSCVGFSTLISAVWVMLVKPKNCRKSSLVVFLDGQDDFSQVNYYFEKFKWYGSKFADQLVFVCMQELSKETYDLCKNYNDIRFISYSCIKDIVE